MNESDTFQFFGIRMALRSRRPVTIKAKHRPGYVYLVAGNDHFKIGRSKNLPARMSSFGLHLPFPVKLIHAIPAYDCVWAEAILHDVFSLYRVNGEWFKLDVAGMFTFTLFSRNTSAGWVMAWELEESERLAHQDAAWWSIFDEWWNRRQPGQEGEVNEY